MKYRQITSGERYAIAALRKRKLSIRAIAAELGRSPSTISREVSRNLSSQRRYTPTKADSYAVARRRRSRRNAQFGADDWVIVDQLLELDWSPEQVSEWLRRHGILSISHETIYLHVWHDKREGGGLWRHLRQATKKRRKRNGSRDSRGRLAGKRHISERPPEVEDRQTPGHWEIDTVKGDDQARHSVITIVERATGFLLMGKIERHCAADTTARSIELILRHEGLFATITSDKWQRVPQLQGHRGRHRGRVLLRHPAPLMGARHQREHERADPPVPAQAHEHGAHRAVGLRRDRDQTQLKTKEEAELQDTGGMLCTIVGGLRGSVALQT